MASTKKTKATPSREADEPMWGSESGLVKIKGAGAQKVTKLHIELPDGSIAPKKAASELVVWPAARLRVIFDAYHLWWGSHGTRWHDAAVSAAMDLAALVSPSWILHDTIDRWDDPVLKPEPFSKKTAVKHASKTLFATKPPMPWTVLRDGAARGVRYQSSLLVLNGSVQVFLPPTPENVVLLEKTLDSLAGRVSFAWAGVGYGLAGWASSLALGGPVPAKLEQKRPALDADWLVWLGDRWRETPAKEALVAPLEQGTGRGIERKGALTRISVRRPGSSEDAKGAAPAKALSVDLGRVAAKINALARRAALRRPVRGR